jgi:plastocyanin
MESDNQQGNSSNALIFIVAIVGAIITFAILSIHDNGGLKFLGDGQAPSTNAGTTESKPVADAAIAITSSGFLPQTITVAKDQQVTFVNSDRASHQVVSDDASPTVDSDTLSSTDTYSYTFEKEGTYQLHDRLNPLKNKLTIIVK